MMVRDHSVRLPSAAAALAGRRVSHGHSLATSTFQVFGGLTGALLYAKGHGGLQLRISLTLVVGHVIAVLTGGWFGLDGIAFIIGLVNVAYGVIAVVTPARLIGICPRIVLRGLLAPFGCAVAASVACELLVRLFGSQNLTVILAELLSLLLYVGLLIMLERRRLVNDIAMLRTLLRKKPVT